MQGEIDWKLIGEFASIPDSRIVHLNYNKHELTIVRCQGLYES
jgi:23S rRNA (cytidine2498-2'-O)-methyltransferase